MIALKEQPASTPSLQLQPLPAHSFQRSKRPFRLTVVESPDLETERGRSIRNILVPTDLSPRSAKAVGRAGELARQHDATLTICHVVDINSPATLTHCGTAKDLMRQLWVTGISQLRQLAEALVQSQTKTRTLIVEGLPAEAIVENSSGFDLLVLGEEHSKSTWNLFPRHTARQVIQGAACPVLLVDQEASRVGRQAGTMVKVAA